MYIAFKNLNGFIKYFKQNFMGTKKNLNSIFDFQLHFFEQQGLHVKNFSLAALCQLSCITLVKYIFDFNIAESFFSPLGSNLKKNIQYKYKRIEQHTCDCFPYRTHFLKNPQQNKNLPSEKCPVCVLGNPLFDRRNRGSTGWPHKASA